MMENKGDKGVEDLVGRYIRAYREKISLYKEQAVLEKELETLEKQEVVFKDIVLRCCGKNMDINNARQQYPIILGASLTRMSVTSLGKLPEDREDMFHSDATIYPIGYAMKRKYFMHKHYKRKSRDKVIYTCKIDKDCVFKIEADDGYKWEGRDIWNDFAGSFDNEMHFKSIEDFFGFSHRTLLRLIEGLGDTKRFKKYVPVDERSNESNVSQDSQAS